MDRMIGRIDLLVSKQSKRDYFLKSIVTSNISKNADNLFELLDSMVDEIDKANAALVVTERM